MICKSIDYYNFRNIKSAHIELHSGINVLCGDNAEGKTNAIEGIYIFAGGRSFRSRADTDLIKFGEKIAAIKLVYCDSVRQNSLEFSINQNKKRMCRRNSVPLRKLSEFVGNFQAVLFCPEHLSIVKNGPSDRRLFIDSAISQINPVYLASLQRYNAVMKQRNALLKKQLFTGRPVDEKFRDNLEVWSEQLAAEAEYIASARNGYVKILCEKTSGYLTDMTAGRDKISITYDEPLKKEEYLEKLKSNVEREVKNGTTCYGIHRDDIDILIEGKDARYFASQGQQRSAALSMKLAEGNIIYDKIGEYPVFLLDDILSELDEKRKNYILNGLENRQVIITSCGSDIGGDRIFRVKNGTYEEQ